MSICPAPRPGPARREPRSATRPPRRAGHVRRVRSRLGLTLAALVTTAGAHALLASTAQAQDPVPAVGSAVGIAGTVTLAGVVRDSAGRPLSGVQVRAGAGSLTLTDAEGRFELGGLTPDTVRVQVRGVGYRPMEATLEAGAGVRVEIAVKLLPVVELTTVTIEGERRDQYLLQGGFYERQKRGRGVFFDPEQLERMGGSLVTLVSTVPGVAMAVGHAGIQTAVGSAGAGGRCALNVILDGVELRWMDEIGLDRLLHRNEIRAVEVYARPTDVPVELYSFGRSRLSGGGITGPLGTRGGEGAFGDCGTIVIWSRPAG